MSYKSLYKLFVMNNYSEFEKIYLNRFNSNCTVKFNIYINEYQSFINYDKEIIALIARIKESDNLINELMNEIPKYGLKSYIRKSLIEEVYFTNKIEGVILSIEDINELADDIENGNSAFNNLEGIIKKYLFLLNEKMFIEDSFTIRKIFNEMLYEKIKEEDINNIPDGIIFRKNDVHVLSENARIIHTGILPEENIIKHMNTSIGILNDSSIDILIRIALFHYLFGYIHPFYDGNGRLNRYISSYYLSKNLHPLIGCKLSSSIYLNLSSYYNAFDHTNDIRNRADLSTFVYYFLTIVYKTYQIIETDILEKVKEYNLYLNNINNMHLFEKDNEEEIKIINTLVALTECTIFGEFGISKRYLCKMMKKGRTRVTEYLVALKKNNLCTVERKGNHYFYKANLDNIK